MKKSLNCNSTISSSRDRNIQSACFYGGRGEDADIGFNEFRNYPPQSLISRLLFHIGSFFLCFSFYTHHHHHHMCALYIPYVDSLYMFMQIEIYLYTKRCKFLFNGVQFLLNYIIYNKILMACVFGWCVSTLYILDVEWEENFKYFLALRLKKKHLKNLCKSLALKPNMNK